MNSLLEKWLKTWIKTHGNEYNIIEMDSFNE